MHAALVHSRREVKALFHQQELATPLMRQPPYLADAGNGPLLADRLLQVGQDTLALAGQIGLECS
ncbi:MAG: hypothetical protein FJ026_12815 [Chloroflexi bacterium]|nr:hypothetical protein [Chloroflexota bacterium]